MVPSKNHPQKSELFSRELNVDWLGIAFQDAINMSIIIQRNHHLRQELNMLFEPNDLLLKRFLSLLTIFERAINVEEVPLTLSVAKCFIHQLMLLEQAC